MSNGGYTGTTPARETSPEQYPGVWELTEQFQAQADGNWPFQDTDCATKSLRLNGSNGYLSRAFSSSGSQTTWSLSCWIKRANLDTNGTIFASSTLSSIRFSGGNGIEWLFAGNYGLFTSNRFRDPSAWAHYLFVLDTTNSVADDRQRIYLNNELLTAYDQRSNRSLNNTPEFNSGQTHAIAAKTDGSVPLGGCIAEVQFIDGQALTPDAFTFIDGQGIIQPKRFTGDYSSGPVYSTGTLSANPYAGNILNVFDSNIHPQQSLSGSAGNQFYVYNQNAITYTFPQPLTGTFKVYAGNGDWNGSSSSSGGTISINTGASVTLPTPGTQFYYATVGAGTNVTSITFNPANGGLLMGAIYVDDVQLVDASVGRNSFHLDFSDGVKDQSGLGNDWTANNIELPGPLVQDWESMLTGAHDTNHGWGTTYGSDNMFDGDLNTYTIGQANATGLTFTPTSPLGASATTIRIYGMDDNCPDSHLIINGVNYGGLVNSGTTWTVLKGTGAVGSGITSITSIYLRDNSLGNQHYRFAALEIDGVIVTQGGDPDLFVDSPVNGNQTDPSGLGGIVQGNYATWNPLTNSNVLCSDGNLVVNTTSNDNSCFATQSIPDNGKVYFEFTCIRRGGGGAQSPLIGVGDPSGVTLNVNPQNSTNYSSTWLYGGNGYKTGGGSATTSYGDAFVAGDVIGVCIDRSSSRIWFSKNNVWQNSGDPTDPTDSNAAFTNVPASGTLIPFYGNNNSTSGYGSINFGARPFRFSAPTSYKTLNTASLPEPSIPIPSQYFDTKLYSGTGSALSITMDNSSMSPDFVWLKARNDGADHHHLFDTVRGAGKRIFSNLTNAESTDNNTLSSFDSNGFSLGTQTAVNGSGDSMVAWAFDAGDATTTIAAGGLNSSVYDQSQTWSSLVTGTLETTYGNSDVTVPFNGSTGSNYTDGIRPLSGNYLSMNFGTTFANATTVKIYGHASLDGVTYSGTNENLKINGTALTASEWADNGGGTGSGQQSATFTLSSGLTSLEWGYSSGSQSTGYLYLQGIEVDGKLLVNSSLTPPNVPTIASTVRANPSAGFSIVTATASSAGDTICHGLNAPLGLIIAKRTNVTSHWPVYHSSVGANGFVYLNLTNAAGTGSDFWNNVTPTSSVFTVGSDSAVSGGSAVFYCFAPVAGYSAMSSFSTNGTADNVFVFTGFRPSFLMTKRTDGVGNWIMYDAKRDVDNLVENRLRSNQPNAEDTTNAGFDFLSNGFKVRTSVFASGQTHLYLAFAENPFKTARAR